MPRNPLLCSFVSFSIVWIICFVNKLESSRDLTVSIISSISSFLLFLYDNFLWIPASAADAVSVNFNGIKTLLTDALSTFFINGKPIVNGKPIFTNSPKGLPGKAPDCIILDNSFMLAEKLFAKALRRFATYLLVNNNLWGKSASGPWFFSTIKKFLTIFITYVFANIFLQKIKIHSLYL